MKKKEMIKRVREINARFKELADTLEVEKRSMTAEEQAEKEALTAEKAVLELRMLQTETNMAAVEQSENRSRVFSECVKYMKRGIYGDNLPEEYRSLLTENGLLIPITRDVIDSTGVGAIVPLTIGEVIEPLEKGLILDKVGTKMQYGIVGAWQFPVVAGGVEAELQDENVDLTDKKIDITKIVPEPRRVGISIPVSNRAIDQSADLILDIVRKQLYLAIQRLLNKWMFNKTQLSKASKGCFVDAYAAPAVTFAGDVPTWAEVLNIEAAVMEEGVVMDGTAAWVCSASMFAKLKAAPKDAGSGRFIVEDGMIDGYPVFVTEYVEKDMLGFGVFSYELVGQFGEMRMTVDSTSAAVAKKNMTYFVFNTDFDMLTLRSEAFAVGKTA
jgi:HK97 family phage major capsid protein